MTLPTGSLSAQQIVDELRIPNPGRARPVSLQDADVRALSGVSGAAVSFDDLRGKSAYVAMSGSVPDVPDATATSGANYTAHVSIAISVSGGTPPLSYAWSRLSGTAGTTVTAANAASTTADFPVASGNPPGTVKTEVVQCVVTDSASPPRTLTRSGTVTLTLD